MNNINFLLTISTHNRQKRLLELKKKRSPKGNDLIIYQIISFSSSTKSMEISLTHRRFEESSYFVPPHKRLLNPEQHSFHTLSQSHFTFQILEGWPRPQGNPIITRSARNSEKALIVLDSERQNFDLLNQLLEYSVQCITLAKERKEGKR